MLSSFRNKNTQVKKKDNEILILYVIIQPLKIKGEKSQVGKVSFEMTL